MTEEVSNKIKPTWHHIDAKDKVVGRVATEAAGILIGKNRADYAPHKALPAYVIITNTDHISFTGKKLDQKMYRHYTGYPGGLKERSAREQMSRDSRMVVEAAISGMLPKNNLRAVRLRHLKLYTGSEHPHMAQLTPGGDKSKKESK